MNKIKDLFLKFLPWPLRFVWPFKKYYWQPEEIKRIEQEANRLAKMFGDQK